MTKIFITSILAIFGLLSLLSGQEFIQIDSLKKHVAILASDSLEGRGFGFSGKQMAVNYIAREFKAAGLKPFTNNYLQSFIHKVAMIRVEVVNIIGLVEGSDPVLKNEFIVLGAHYDHLGWEMKDGKKIIFNGADDNASGVASIIEIGRFLATNKNLLKRSVIIVAFDGEEVGLFGSSAFLSEKIVDSTNIKIMFSLDMVGMYEKNNGLDLNDMNSIINGEKLAEKISNEKNVKINKTANTIEMRTDTWSFAKHNIPAVHVFTGEKSPYHKPEDDSDLLDYNGMVKVDEFMCNLTKDLSSEEVILADKQFMTKSTKPFFKMGFSLSMGSNKHIYKNEYFTAKPLFAFETGIIAQLMLSKYIILQPEILYETTGSQTELGNLRMHSFSPEFNLLLTTSNTKKDIPFVYLLVGGYYRNNFAGKEDGHSVDFNTKYAKNETGINFGIGFQILKYQMGFYQKLGFNNVLQNNTNGEIINKSNYFSIAYYF
jgi:aminopeptidase YwaD